MKTHICVHHTASLHRQGGKQLQGVNNYHREQKFPYSARGYWVGYHYFIEEDGTVIQTRNPQEMGAHCYQQSMNSKSFGICLAGNFDVQMPTEAQKISLLALIKELQQKYSIKKENIKPHRHYASYKSCWGNNLPDDIISFLESAEKKPSPWAEEAIKVAKELGITHWSNPQEPMNANTLAWTLRKLGHTSSGWNGKEYVPLQGGELLTIEQFAVFLHRSGLLKKQ